VDQYIFPLWTWCSGRKSDLRKEKLPSFAVQAVNNKYNPKSDKRGNVYVLRRAQLGGWLVVC
jgi:hypothetical protein